MSSDSPRSTAVEALATLGAVFWSIQLLPQIFLNYRRQSTEGLHSSMMILWALAGLPLGIHNILSEQHIALVVQAQILTGLSLITWAQTMYYGKRWSAIRCTSVTSLLMIGFGGIEAALVLGFKYGDVGESSRRRFVLSMAILSAIGLALGVLRHYYDIYQERTVRGISWGFVLLDAMGDLTSLLAIALHAPIDPVAAVIYATELVLWIGIMIAGLGYNLPRAIKKHKAARRGDLEPQLASLERTQSPASSVFGVVRSRAHDLPTFGMRRRAGTGE
ncbi:hypothetical protein FFLO_03857 [Filobasidium floriforme]|uniref:PQ loop repeat protein n=1 Tax=Filobasidium floriforme TaxID=5210 RepID=A0A8K0NMW1_9TREE|nr:PQ loop repeat-domain-containing protein [Filobasidium floriforme]KAG7532115.1 hypothetical protein FFLO_03857 [Filobasidium floriforme]KAH8078385.1 PQ loop repeat-domain-containing protein [Filobasidium floriforme]